MAWQNYFVVLRNGTFLIREALPDWWWRWGVALRLMTRLNYLGSPSGFELKTGRTEIRST